MPMRARHGHASYELNDEWWEAAGMPLFVPTRPAFRADTTGLSLPVLEVAISDIEPVDRQLSHGVFNLSLIHI